MKRSTLQRIALSGLVALSVAGSTLAPVVAGHAAAECRNWSKVPGQGVRPICLDEQ
jgi:hypothetical protein